MLRATGAQVFVAGATGQTCRRIVSQLRAAGVAVRAGARDAKKAQSLGFAAAGAEIVHADVTEGVDALVEAIGSQTSAVVCATGFSPTFNFGKDNAKMVDGVGTKALIDAAKKAGVKRFVLVTSLLTNAPALGQSENPNYKVREVCRLSFARLFCPASAGACSHSLRNSSLTRWAGYWMRSTPPNFTWRPAV